MLFGALAFALLVFLGTVVASLRRSHDVGGLLTGIVSGLVAALLVGAAGAWLAMWLVSPKLPQPAPDLILSGALQRELAPSLTELEAIRVDTLRQVNVRLLTRVPCGLATAFGLWLFSQLGRDPGTLFNLLEFMGLGGAIGWYWASRRLSDTYARRYKDRVLPKLAAQFGSLSYRRAIQPDLRLLRAQRIFREFDTAVAEDEIYGTYRGLPLNIVELKLTSGSGKEEREEFNGLVLTVELPRRLSGSTAVIADNGALGNFTDRFTGGGAKRVGLEDPSFEKVYEVYGTDQVEARALLTPTFMERFLTLGERPGFLRPLAVADGNRLTIALPQIGGRNLFEAPNYREPAASRSALERLYGDIRAVIGSADSVIDLDRFRPTVRPLKAGVEAPADKAVVERQAASGVEGQDQANAEC